MTLMTNNELIAEFMGFMKTGTKYQGHGSVVHEQYKSDAYGMTYPHEWAFERRWDWLMPVVERIQSINIEPAPNYRGYRIEIVVQGYVKISGYPMPSITTNVANEGSLLNAVYKAVIEFIKWYNSQK